MKCSLYLVALTLFTSIVLNANTSNEMSFADRENFIEKYVDLAVKEMHRTGIPASIKMAQFILESSWGKSELYLYANAGFGVKVKNEGEPYYEKEDDDRDEYGNLIKSRFRKYESIEESFIDHSNFLSTRKYYEPLFDLNRYDYKGWAKGLKSCGYATADEYGERLISIIETYDLFRFDYRREIKAAPVYVQPQKKQKPAPTVLAVPHYNAVPPKQTVTPQPKRRVKPFIKTNSNPVVRQRVRRPTSKM